ncbi:hypothetical protein BC829DRAFT_388225 [Chytridium lagenaria]|nr:hypothetical protein BC829DRAFT_388225 [Chytridium lagenaria]
MASSTMTTASSPQLTAPPSLPTFQSKQINELITIPVFSFSKVSQGTTFFIPIQTGVPGAEGRSGYSGGSYGLSTFVLVIIGASCGIFILTVWFLMVRCALFRKLNIVLGNYFKPRPTVTKSSPSEVQHSISASPWTYYSNGAISPTHGPPPPPGSSGRSIRVDEETGVEMVSLGNERQTGVAAVPERRSGESLHQTRNILNSNWMKLFDPNVPPVLQSPPLLASSEEEQINSLNVMPAPTSPPTSSTRLRRHRSWQAFDRPRRLSVDLDLHGNADMGDSRSACLSSSTTPTTPQLLSAASSSMTLDDDQASALEAGKPATDLIIDVENPVQEVLSVLGRAKRRLSRSSRNQEGEGEKIGISWMMRRGSRETALGASMRRRGSDPGVLGTLGRDVGVRERGIAAVSTVEVEIGVNDMTVVDSTQTSHRPVAHRFLNDDSPSSLLTSTDAGDGQPLVIASARKDSTRSMRVNRTPTPPPVMPLLPVPEV